MNCLLVMQGMKQQANKNNKTRSYKLQGESRETR